MEFYYQIWELLEDKSSYEEYTIRCIQAQLSVLPEDNFILTAFQLGAPIDETLALNIQRYGCKTCTEKPLDIKEFFGLEVESDSPPTPSTLDMAKSVGISVMEWMKQGANTRTKEDRDIVLNICHTCLNYQNGRCTRCGCFMAIKTWMDSEHCPDGKW